MHALATPTTVAALLPMLEPGDTLWLEPGEYPAMIGVKVQPAIPGHPITVRALPGGEVVIRNGFRLSGCDHWTFVGLTMTADTTGEDTHLVRLRGRHITLEDCHIYQSHAKAGIQLAEDDWVMRRCHIHDTIPHSYVPGATSGANQDHNVYVAGGSFGYMERCVIHGAPNGRNVKVGSTDPAATVPASTMFVYCTFVGGGAGNCSLSYGAHDNQWIGCVFAEPNVTYDNGDGYRYQNIDGYHLSGANNRVSDSLLDTGVDIGIEMEACIVAPVEFANDTYRLAERHEYLTDDGRYRFGHLAGEMVPGYAERQHEAALAAVTAERDAALARIDRVRAVVDERDHAA
jgi:hypothetical protein